MDQLTQDTNNWSNMLRHIQDLTELSHLALEQNDHSFLEEIDQAIDRLDHTLTDQVVALALTGPHDDRNAIITIQAGAGGAEANLWSELLLGMYTAWANRKQRPIQLLDITHVDHGGIRSTTLEIMGPKPYGHLKGEAEIHRLVRISPLDPAGRRHTSFSRVKVLPVTPEQDQANAPSSQDVRFEAFHSSAPGGQHVQKVASAVRLTHITTGISVTAQTERSQLQNRRYAMRLLTARIQKQHRREQEETIQAIRGQPSIPTWGMRNRSYTLQPEQHVVDHRTGYRTANTAAVLDGKLDDLIYASLLQIPSHENEQ